MVSGIGSITIMFKITIRLGKFGMTSQALIAYWDQTAVLHTFLVLYAILLTSWFPVLQ